MDPILQEAKSIQEIIVNHRHYLHRHAELGMDLPVTKAYVIEQLTKMGYEPKEICPSGLVATVGKNKSGKTFLIRGDMDALPIKEESDLEFKSETNAMHACGHDTHTAMMLGAAQILKKHENEIEGLVKLMFQPGEEIVAGAKAMVAAGILENPKVDAAMMIHSMAGIPIPSGTLVFTGVNTSPSSADIFRIDVTGKGSHGAMANMGIDPLNVMAHIHTALQELNAREMPTTEMAILTIGQMHGGAAANVIPETAFMEGTVRTKKPEIRKQMLERLSAISENIATAFRAKAEVKILNGCPSVVVDQPLVKSTMAYAKEILGSEANVVYADDEPKANALGGGSEDFAFVSEKVPSIMVMLCLGSPEEGYLYPQHHPKIRFDESKLYLGSAAYAGIAMRWLRDNK
ncbi:MAG TPA: M20 family metallopeptidase [Spirochaetales bacterium]|nr:M20 family metallopeptidase [Spirochaetales bacterium]